MGGEECREYREKGETSEKRGERERGRGRERGREREEEEIRVG